MGLDQYWVSTERGFVPQYVDDNDKVREIDKGNGHNQGAYATFEQMRKVPALQDYMEKIYRKRGGEKEFNTVMIELSAEDIAQMIIDFTTGQINKNASGFFWGEHIVTDVEDVIEVADQALEKIRLGGRVYYDSWW